MRRDEPSTLHLLRADPAVRAASLAARRWLLRLLTRGDAAPTATPKPARQHRHRKESGQ
jgi:hypothetical protein